MKRFFLFLLIASICFLIGVAVGRFVMPRQINIIVVNIKDLVEVIERYNELKYELDEIREWNEEAIIEPEPEEEKK